ncbi:MAG: hypothetical protein VYA39_01035 [Candidatus Thermoplasmatota archaeon]|nr:hypothetical protein [Candidatus Thermoplasmatota archaeon]
MTRGYCLEKNKIVANLSTLLFLLVIISPVASSQEQTSEEVTFEYHTIASLGDSTLGSDPTGYRGPFASIHASNLMGLEYYEGAVGGDRSWTLINAGRHTTIADNYGEGTLVTMMVGAWDFIDSDIDIVNGDYSFIDDLEDNITIILDTLVESEIDVLVWNLPNMSFLPFLTQIFPVEVHPHFTEASKLWANRLDEIAFGYGDSVQVFDLMTASDDLLQNQSARMIGDNQVIAPPTMCDKNCIMIDSLHPTSVGQGLLANYMMLAINEKFPSPMGDYPILSEEDLLGLADFEMSSNSSDEMMIEGDVTKSCFDWTDSVYRDMYLTITRDGSDVIIPSYIGFNTEVCRQSTHVMYTGERSINVISNIQNNLTLNHFFEIWGQNFSDNQVMDMSTDSGASISMYIDGIEFTGDWDNVDLAGVVSIEIVYTSPKLPTDSLPSNDPSQSQNGRVPGFSGALTSIAIICAFIVGNYRRKSDFSV